MISYSKMPVSFTSRAMVYSAEQNSSFDDWRKDTFDSYTISHFIGSAASRGLQVAVHSIYCLAVALLIAPGGIAFHAYQSLKNRVYASFSSSEETRDRYSSLAWEHFKASAMDILGCPRALVEAILTIICSAERDAKLAYECSSGSAVKVSHYKDNASDKMKNYLNGLNVSITDKNWGVNAYLFRVCQAYNYCDLVKHRLEIKIKHRELLSLNDKSILKDIHFKTAMKSATDPEVEHIIRNPNLLDTELDSIKFDVNDPQPDYKFPWKSVAYGVGIIATLALAALVISMTPYLAVPLIPVVLMTTLIVGSIAVSVLGIGARDSYIENRGQAEVECFKKYPADGIQSAKKALFWLKKACNRNYAAAQRIYGLTLMSGSNSSRDLTFQEGFQWLLKSIDVISMSEDVHKAKEDLKSMVLLNPGNHPQDPNFLNLPATAQERFTHLFKGVDVVDAASKRYGAMLENGTNLKILKARKIVTRAKRHTLANLLSQDNRNGDQTFCPDIALSIAEFCH